MKQNVLFSEGAEGMISASCSRQNGVKHVANEGYYANRDVMRQEVRLWDY